MALKKKVDMFENTWIETSTWGLGMALVYWIIFSQLRIPMVSVEVIGVAVATAIVEELVFSGFIAGYLERFSKVALMNAMIDFDIITKNAKDFCAR